MNLHESPWFFYLTLNAYQMNAEYHEVASMYDQHNAVDVDERHPRFHQGSAQFLSVSEMAN